MINLLVYSVQKVLVRIDGGYSSIEPYLPLCRVCTSEIYILHLALKQRFAENNFLSSKSSMMYVFL